MNSTNSSGIYTWLLSLIAVGVVAVLSFGAPFDIPHVLKHDTTQDTKGQAQKSAPSTQEKIVPYRIQPGDTFIDITQSLGISYSQAQDILVASKRVYDFSNVQAGKVMHAVFVKDALAAVDYDIRDDAKIVVDNTKRGFRAQQTKLPYTSATRTVSSRVDTSLYRAATLAGLPPETIIDLIDIFASQIDFSVEVAPGDTFSVVYEKRTRDGEEISPGRIFAAIFTNKGEQYSAYYFETADGEGGYYTADGVSLRRQFIRSPLDVGYVSSGFSNRRVNPVTKEVTPHRAIDYAAPRGTPIVATADGAVTYAGDNGEYGIFVELEHDNSYVSEYAHLDSMAAGVVRGKTVTRGQVIGYVGSTGLSTGPHLQYALSKNGTAINPLTADLPAGEKLPAVQMQDFRATVETMQAKLDDV